MIKTITSVSYLEDVALVTVNHIPNSTRNIAFILNEIASRGITVDMICQTAPYKEKINLYRWIGLFVGAISLVFLNLK